MTTNPGQPAGRANGLFFRVFPAVMLPMFIAISDQTLVSTALPSIAAELGQVHLIAWVVVAYLMTNTLTSPVYGRLSDMVGRRRMMLIALVLVVFGALICITAPRMEILVLGRALQGLGGGGLMSLSQAAIGQMVPPRDRGRYQGYLATINTTATVAGPILGGILTHHFGWRAALAFSIPLAILAMVMATRLPNAEFKEKMTNFDGLGLAYFAATVLPLLLAIQQLQRIAGGDGGAGIFFLSIAIAGSFLWLLFRRERKAANPLFSPQLLSNPAIWRSSCAAACYGAAFVSLVAFTSLYLRVARGLDADHVGVMLLTLTLGVGISSFVTGQLVSRTGRTAVFPSTGLSTLTILLLVFALISPNLVGWQLSGFYFSMSLCFGTVMGALQVTVQHVAGRSQIGAAASVLQFSRSLGATIGTSLVSAAVFISLQFGDGTAAEIFRQALEGGSQSLAHGMGHEMRQELMGAFQPAFLVVAAFSAFACVMAWSIPVRSIFADTDRR